MRDKIKVLDYQDPYGTWKVTTEADAEGKGTRQLGVYTGFIDKIAFALANRCYYSLHFTKIHPEELDLTPKKKEVSITLDIESGTWDLKVDARVDYINNGLLKDRPCFATSKGPYGAVTLTTEQETIEEKRIKILEKLTDEEKMVLGLN